MLKINEKIIKNDKKSYNILIKNYKNCEKKRVCIKTNLKILFFYRWTYKT